TPPTITCPAVVNVECVSAVPDPNTGLVTASDNCLGQVTVTHVGDVPSGTTCPMTITRTYQATDVCGNSATCTQIITVNDQTAPIPPPPPANVVVQCDVDVPAAVNLTATDNCDGDITVSPTDQVLGGTCTHNFTVTRTWTFTDACGNSSSAVQTITVDDTTPPTITCPAMITVQCSADVPPTDFAGGSVTDNCSGTPIVIHLSDNTDGMVPETITRTYQATDICGNTSTCTQTIVVDNNAPPNITCPQDTMVECVIQVPPPDINSVITSTACGEPPIVTHVGDVSDGLTCPQTITRTYLATDAFGNTTTCTQLITVLDTTPPVPPSPPANVTVECPGDIPSPLDLAANDNCDGDLTVSPNDQTTPGSCINGFVVTRTWTFTDACGNSTAVSQIITVDDTTPPTITCPVGISVECVGDAPAPDINSVITSDNCPGAIIVVHLGDVPDGQSCPMTISRTYQASDACGNTATCIQLITVNDQTPPVPPNPPANQAFQCAEDIPTGNNLTATDNCDGVITAPPVDVISQVSCTHSFLVTRTWTFTDACGNAASVSQIITIDDTTPPTIVCPANVTVQCSDDLPAPNFAGGSTSDNCTGTVNVVHGGDVSDGMIPETVTRTYIATDECGNSSSCIQTITVDNNAPPNIQCPPTLFLDCTDPIPPADPNLVTGGGACGGGITVVHLGDVSNGFNCPETITRTYEATDISGNVITCVQRIIIDDTTPPTVTTCPANESLGCFTVFEPTVADLPAAITDPALLGASDDCFTMTVSHIDAGPFISGCAYTFERTYTVTDECGNATVCPAQIFSMTFDNEPPVFSNVPVDVDIDCFAPIPTGGVGNVTAFDDCSGSLTVTFEEIAGTVGCLAESYQRIWTAVDGCGNIGTAIQNITRRDLTVPGIIVPDDTTIICGEDIPPAEYEINENCTRFEEEFNEVVISGDCVCEFTIMRTWWARNGCGDVARDTQFVYVIDTSAPIITLTNPILEGLENGGTIVTYDCEPPEVLMTDIIADDCCAGVDVFTYDSLLSFNTCDVFGYYQLWACGYVATDPCGNSSEFRFLVEQYDTLAPFFNYDSTASDLELACGESIPPIPVVTADDNCPNDPLLEFREDTVGDFTSDSFAIIRNWEATDVCQNVHVLTQTVEFCGFQVDSFIATIGNIVWFDENKNGIQESHEFGLNGIIVNLYRDLDLDSIPELFPFRSTMTKTWYGQQGLYFFENLNPGHYFVEFIPDNNQLFTLYQAGTDKNIDSDVDPATGMSSLIVISEGEVNIAVDAGLTSLRVLPVELSYFDGRSEDCINTLRWATSFELDNEGFVVERSADGVDFTTIGQLSSKGNTSVGFEYFFTDRDPYLESFYRLQQRDADGTFSISQIIKINQQCHGVIQYVEIFPNPVKDKFTLSYDLSENEDVDFRIYNHLGQVLEQWKSRKSPGLHRDEIDLSNMPNGLYWIQIATGQKPVQKSVIKND
ncbi:MAG: T9SS type A sorting domain-containing protein, partial [Saprospiraceae bacterium]|nr:T9SS type A sorting domain-containing protein [Saprospiraceae bacterium]